MEKIRIDDIDRRVGPASVKRPLTDAIDAAHVSLNYYELAPGESFAYGYHSHDSQEELFVIQQGQVTFETETGDVEVDAGDVIRFAPGESQQGINTSDERVVALAIGAPQATGETEILRECPACEERTSHTVERIDDGQATRARCLVCDEQTGRFQ